MMRECNPNCVLFIQKLHLLYFFFLCRVLSDYISMIALKLYKASHSALSSLAGWTVAFLPQSLSAGLIIYVEKKKGGNPMKPHSSAEGSS